MPTYETVFAVPAALSEEERAQSLSDVEGMIAETVGVVSSNEEMGEKRLAYPVKKHEVAYYYLINFESPSSSIEKLTRFYRHSSDVYIRHIVVRKDGK